MKQHVTITLDFDIIDVHYEDGLVIEVIDILKETIACLPDMEMDKRGVRHVQALRVKSSLHPKVVSAAG